jgi:putative membrane protein
VSPHFPYFQIDWQRGNGLISITFLPALNACLNALSATLLSVGYLCIRSKKVLAHKICMISALLCTGLFLTSYLYYHFHAGATPFPGTGSLRIFYFTVLISHTILAVAIVPLIIITLIRAFRGKFERHAKIARWTLPLWLYVSVTGVLIYYLLYALPFADSWR